MFRRITEGFGRLFRLWFSLDYRSLAALRIGVGFALLCDVIQRSVDITAFYTDTGVLPRAELFRLWNMDWFWSLHVISGNAYFQALLLAVAGIAAIMLILGYRTRLASIVSWILLISIQTRHPLILQGGDIVLRTILFFMLFLPLGRRWSLDRLFNRVPPPQKEKEYSLATFGYILQICLLYFFTGILKTGIQWHSEASAVYYALSIDQFLTPVGETFARMHGILPLLTRVVWHFETFGIFLFFIPWRNWIFRTIGIFGFILMQAGFNVSMRLGLFGVIAITTLLGLLPSEFWDKIIDPIKRKISGRAKEGLVIVYDYDCTFCQKISFILKRFLLLSQKTVVISSSESPAAAEIMERENSWVIYDKNEVAHTGWDGVCVVFSYSPYAKVFVPLLRLVKPFGEKLYRSVANKRKQVCQPEPTEIPLSNTKKRLVQFVLFMGIATAITWNLSTLKILENPPILRPFAHLTRMDQRFNMFAPYPLTEDGWYVMPGELRDGSQIDIFTGASPVSYDKPEHVSYLYKNQRWQKYLMNLWTRDHSEYRLGYGRYLCRSWNKKASPDKQLISFNITFMLEKTPPPGEPYEAIVPTTIWRHRCFTTKTE